MIVCVCRRVSDRQIVAAAREGCSSFEALQAELGVAQACGRCRDCAHEVMRTAVHALGASAAVGLAHRPPVTWLAQGAVAA